MDRLSGLPNDVIFYIISFLPMKSSVRTSILAKEWRFRWANVPGLGFTCNRRFGGCCREDSKFMQINHNSKIFHRGSSNHNHDFESWIVTMFERSNIRNLVIIPNYRLKLPRSLFTCETLVCLRILDCDVIPDDGVVHFPALKELQLVNVGYRSPASLENLISGCPVIEELTIERMKASCCDIRATTAPNLHRLVINIGEVDNVRLKLIPKVRYLRVRVRKTGCIVAYYPLDSLIEADINFVHESNNISFYPLLAALCNLKCLTLSTPQLKLADSEFYQNLMVKFHNLIELNLCADWRFITFFLENADNLRVFNFSLMVDHNSTPYWMEPRQVSACLVSSLETLNLVDFEWSTRDEFDMVKYILKNATVLKEMKITCTRDFEVKFEDAIKRVAMLEIGSPSCHLTFVPA